MTRLCLVLAALALCSCATPTIPPMSGGAANAEETKAGTGTLEPQVGLVSPGAIGGVTQSKLAYQRQETGSQSAPQLALNLQPGTGATVAASYPALTTIAPVFIVFMGNSQRDATLTAEQLEKIAGAAEKAGAAVKGIIEATPAPGK